MNNILTYAVGVDGAIQRLQTYLYEKLYVKWGASGLTADKFEMFGRVYRNSVKDGFAPQAFTGDKIDYMQDMYLDDRLSVLMWFGLNDPINVDGLWATYNVSLYCFCLLPELYPSITGQRVDEMVRQDVVQLINNGNRYGFTVTRIEHDIDNVLKKYSGKIKRDAIVDNNHQPNMSFRVDMSVTVNINQYQLCNAPLAIPLYFNAMTGQVIVMFKDSPNASSTQILVNGVRIPLEYATGNTVTIPHLVGRYVFPDFKLDGNNMTSVSGAPNYIAYDSSTGTFTYGSNYPVDGFQDGSIMLIQYNENS